MADDLCPGCADPLDLYVAGDPLASNVERHSQLFRCPRCGRWYEVVPESKGRPDELTEEQARAHFPSAFVDGAGTTD